MIIISVTVIFDCLLDIRISQVQTISSYSVLPVLKVILNLNQEKKVPRHGCVLQSRAVFAAGVKLCSQQALRLLKLDNSTSRCRRDLGMHVARHLWGRKLRGLELCRTREKSVPLIDHARVSLGLASLGYECGKSFDRT